MTDLIFVQFLLTTDSQPAAAAICLSFLLSIYPSQLFSGNHSFYLFLRKIFNILPMKWSILYQLLMIFTLTSLSLSFSSLICNKFNSIYCTWYHLKRISDNSLQNILLRTIQMKNGVMSGSIYFKLVLPVTQNVLYKMHENIA